MRHMLAIVALALLSPIATAEPHCVAVPYEYCQFGCESLREWVAMPFPSLPEAESWRSSLSPLEQHSAFVVQPPSAYAGALVLRRLLDSQIVVVDRNVPHWEWQEYRGETGMLEAAADAYALGGYVYSTNEPGVTLRVWFVPCVDVARARPARR